MRPAQEMTLADWIAIWQHDLSEDRRSEHRLCCVASNRGLAAGSAAAGLLRYPIPKRPSWLRRTSRSASVASGHGPLWVLRHFFAIALLPFTVAVLIPIWLARRNAVTLVAGSGLTQVSCRSQDVAS